MKFSVVILSLLLSFFIYSCGKDLGKPVVEVTAPEVRSPLYYNGDTMIISALISDTYPLEKIILDIKNQKDSSVFLREFFPNSISYQIQDTFIFHVNDHSNFYMHFNAWNVNEIFTEWIVYIHVMP